MFICEIIKSDGKNYLSSKRKDKIQIKLCSKHRTCAVGQFILKIK